ncbi:aldolase/citrate lyase family protein [Haloarcula sp. S1CR25-12]|uniref:Aldolase/citrate lyase family protein n=1 Tax=Haloarcula saliterrae TaxID=2950534 RepID=A0ABU2FEX0_9EURY|nr:aldolase/citrate lyase family protein [Haloarcula sp. S1CR25-12]MDS0260782.1 aldolase/citrate lyase family protein [Haloarcula sp. S1CR25-12]
MRSENGLRRALEAGETVFGASAETFSPTVIETFGAIGLDFVWLDFEHAGPSPYDSTALEELTRAAEAGDVELLVRLPKPEPALIRKVLDAGVRSILLPRIETAEELEAAVKAAHFAYDGDVGDRGVGVGRSGNWAGYVDSYVGGEDGEVLVGTMIENATAVENIEEILAVPQLGFAFVGPADLSMSLSDGDPLEKNAEAVSAAIDRTLAACLDAGVPIGRIRNDAADAAAAVDAGYQLVRIGGDTASAREVLGARLDELRD